LGPHLYKEQSFHCNAQPMNSAAYPKERPKSKKLCPARANVKVVGDNRGHVRASGYAAATLHPKANILYWIKFRGSGTAHPMSQHSKKFVCHMVFLEADANLVSLKDATLLGCYGILQISLFGQITPAPLLGAEFCQPMARL